MQSYLRIHRLVIYTLVVLFGTFCLWAFIFRLDIVVTAQGKMVPLTQVKLIQPSENGTVHRVLVKDGDPVVLGQTLVDLDPLQIEESRSLSQTEVSLYEEQLKRINAELTGADPLLTNAMVQADYRSRRANYLALVAEATSNLRKAEAELTTASARLNKSVKLAPLAGRQADMLGRLKDAGYMAEAMYNEKLRDKIDTEQEIKVQQEAVRSAQANVAQAQRTLERVATDYRKQLTAEQADYSHKLAGAETDLKKATHKAGLTAIKAPVTGIVTGLTVRNPGQVVPAGVALVSVIPSDEPMQFEGWIRNEDSAFVYPGLPVKVKNNAFPFQKYGWIEGDLTWVGIDTDAPEQSKQKEEPLFYKIRVKLEKQLLDRDGQTYSVKPGMQAIADVQIGTRSLFEYLISPLKKVVHESARER